VIRRKFANQKTWSPMIGEEFHGFNHMDGHRLNWASGGEKISHLG